MKTFVTLLYGKFTQENAYQILSELAEFCRRYNKNTLDTILMVRGGKDTVAELSSCPHCCALSASSRWKTTSVQINFDEIYQIAELCGRVLVEYRCIIIAILK